MKLNLNNRILMFAICTSIEYDLRSYLIHNNKSSEVEESLFNKAKKRNTRLVASDNSSSNHEMLIELDMGDLVSIINSNHVIFEIGKQEKADLQNIFNKIIPIRHKVMHTRPIEFSDRGTLEETLHTLDQAVPFIEWNELIKTREEIKSNPQKLIVETTFTPEIDGDSDVYHNLPVPEFDDTGYIGRKKEIKELKRLITSKNNQVITVVGNGGIGKTAIVVKALYELLDYSHIHDFEAILWVSLKTRTLSKGEFINIQSSIEDLSLMYSELHQNMIVETKNPEEDILSFLAQFSTLLVIDNLETVPTSQIIEFIKSVPANSKVLLTSRSGLGELENRYVLKEMNKNDAREYFISLSKYYQLNLHEQNIEVIDELIKNHLYSSPLSIKWYITSVFFGADKTAVLSDKDKLVEFSMSNIIDKLSQSEIEILWLLLVEGKTLSYGEIDYYLDPKDPQDLIISLNKLLATSMVRDSHKGKYEINGMAKDYLKLYKSPLSDFIVKVSEKRKFLNRMMQEIKTKNEADPFNPKSLFNNLRNENTKISSYYLMKALEHSGKREWRESAKMIEKAQSVAPDYFEVYKIKAFINAERTNFMDAIDAYRTSIENASEDIELASVYYLFSVFYTIKLSDYIMAKEYIDMANKIIPDDPTINLEKGRVHMYLGEFGQALRIFNDIDKSKNRTNKFANQYASKVAELYRRMSGNYENRDVSIKYEYLEKAISEIESLSNIDQTTVATLVKILIDLTYMLHDERALTLFIRAYENHQNLIQNNRSHPVKKLREHIISNKESLPQNIYDSGKNIGRTFKEMSKLETNINEGIIVKIADHYGFIHNAYDSYYFKKRNIEYENFLLGDRVSFVIIDGVKGKEAIKIKNIEQ